jgi:hypothetical protein
MRSEDTARLGHSAPSLCARPWALAVQACSRMQAALDVMDSHPIRCCAMLKVKPEESSRVKSIGSKMDLDKYETIMFQCSMQDRAS